MKYLVQLFTFSIFINLSFTATAGNDIGSDTQVELTLPETSPLDKPALSKEKALAHFSQALYYQMIKKYHNTPIVEKELLTALKLDPSNKLYLTEFLRYYRLNKLSNALKLEELTAILKNAPGSIPICSIVARELIVQNKVEKALTLLEKCYTTNITNKNYTLTEDFITIIDVLANLYIEKKEYDKGDKLYTDTTPHTEGVKPAKQFHFFNNKARFYALTLNELSNTYPLSDTFLYYRQCRNHALKKINALLNSHLFKNGQLLYTLKTFMISNMPEKIIPMYEQAIKKSPKTKAFYLALIVYYQKLGEHQKEFETWLLLIKEGNEPAKSLFRYQSSLAAWRAKKLDKAISILSNYLSSITPNNKNWKKAHYFLTLMYMEKKEYQKALGQLNTLKDTPDILMLRSSVLQKLDRNNDALNAVLQAQSFALVDGNTKFLTRNFYFTLADIAEKCKKIEIVENAMHVLLKKNPNDAAAANFLGYTLADHNIKLKKAENLIKTAVKMRPKSIAYLDSLAWVYYRMNRFTEAKDVILKIQLTMNETGEKLDSVIADHAGDIYAALNDKQKALYFWNYALTHKTLDPSLNKKRIKKKIKDLNNE